MGEKHLKAPADPTLVNRSSIKPLASAESIILADNDSSSTSGVGWAHQQASNRSHRPSQQKGYRTSPKSKRRLSAPPPCRAPPSPDEDARSRDSSPGAAPKSGSSQLQRLSKQLTKVGRRQEQILSILLLAESRPDKAPEVCSAPPPPPLSALDEVALQRYHQMTLDPDPVRLCDMFLARFGLPQVLSGSYDAIELLHMHGWEPEDYGDVELAVRGVVGGGGDEEDGAFAAATAAEMRELGRSDGADADEAVVTTVKWAPVDARGSKQVTRRVARAAALTRGHWRHQGRSVRDPGEAAGAPPPRLESDEFADSVLFLHCPGGSKALLYQSGYDAAGGHVAREPWLGGKRSLLQQLQPYDDRLRIDPTCPWDGRVFGRVWKVFHDQGLLSFACIYLVLSQLGAVVGDASQRMLGTKKALRFLSCYASRWPRFMPTSEVWLSAGWAHLHLHLRVLCAGKRYHEQQRRRRALDGGLRPSRVAGKLASLDGTADVGIVEQRFGLAVATTYTADLPLFTVLYLTDSGYRRLFVESGRPLDVPAAGRLAGVAVFLRILRAVLPLWERRWIESLNEVDNLVGVEVDDLFGPQSGSGVMFDGTSFARSRLYFAVLQTLRIFAEWIQESERELRRLRRDFDAAFRSETARRDSVGSAAGTRPPTRPFSQDVDGAWDEILEFHSAAANALADRIEKKNEEIKSFRDGLFSATSVREASRATSLNQYILVFTFVTIFYLPLSYVSSIFSMNTFAYQDAQTEQSAFLASTVLIAFVTWAVAAVVLWLVQDDARLPRVAARLRRNGAFPPGRREAGEKEPDPVFRGV